MTPETCPECGTELAPNAKACPECGSCEETGWSEEATRARLGLPAEEFDYEEYLKEEFAPEKTRRLPWYWWVGILILIGTLLVGLI